MTKFIFILAALFSCILFISCQQRHVPTYAQEAYLEQRSEKVQGPEFPEFDQKGKEDLFVQAKERYYDPSWDKKAYEDNEEWLIRIKGLLGTNQEILKVAKNEYHHLEQYQDKLAQQTQELIKQNQAIKQQLLDPDKLKVNSATPTLIQGLPFVIHLVQKDETLFAISMKYYNNGSKVRDIMKWNQGWVRNENSIIAGLGLILFPEDAADQDPRVVNSYMEKVRSTEIKSETKNN